MSKKLIDCYDCGQRHADTLFTCPPTTATAFKGMPVTKYGQGSGTIADTILELTERSRRISELHRLQFDVEQKLRGQYAALAEAVPSIPNHGGVLVSTSENIRTTLMSTKTAIDDYVKRIS